MLPEARQEKPLVREVGEELVVYDQDRHRARRLNPTPPGSAATATGKKRARRSWPPARRTRPRARRRRERGR